MYSVIINLVGMLYVYMCRYGTFVFLSTGHILKCLFNSKILIYASKGAEITYKVVLLTIYMTVMFQLVK